MAVSQLGLGTASTHAASDFLTPTGDGSGLSGVATTGTINAAIAAAASSYDAAGTAAIAVAALGTAATHPATDFESAGAVAAAASSYDPAGTAAAAVAAALASGFNGSGAFTTFTITNGIITAAS
jgi:hypothetical protein